MVRIFSPRWRDILFYPVKHQGGCVFVLQSTWMEALLSSLLTLRGPFARDCWWVKESTGEEMKILNQWICLIFWYQSRETSQEGPFGLQPKGRVWSRCIAWYLIQEDNLLWSGLYLGAWYGRFSKFKSAKTFQKGTAKQLCLKANWSKIQGEL